MKRFLFKGLLVIMSVLIFFGAGVVSQADTQKVNGNGFVIVEAASKKIRFKKSKVTLKAGKSFNQKLKDKNGKNIPASKIKWKSADKKIATVSKKGKVTAKKAGKVKITARYKNKKYVFTVIVKADKNQNDNYESDDNIYVETTVSGTYHEESAFDETIVTTEAYPEEISDAEIYVEPTTAPEVDSEPTSPSENIGDPDNDDSDGRVVYTTPSGERYHLDPQCGGKNSSATDLQTAIAKGKTPCQKCAV